jgi:hypothetical protein
LFLKGDGKGAFKSIPAKDSGFRLNGQTRAFSWISVKNNPMLIVANNSNQAQTFTLNKRKN